MGVKVTIGKSTNRVVTSTTSQSKTQTSTTLDGLEGVDTSGVQNGYTLVYESNNGKWEAAPASNLSVNVTAIDGGTFGS